MNQKNYIKKSTWKQRRVFDRRNYIKKSTWKQREFFDQRNYIEKGTWKQRGFQNYIKKRTWKRRRFFNQRNYIENVHGNDEEILWNLVFDVSMSDRREFDIVYPFGSFFNGNLSVTESISYTYSSSIVWRYEP